MFEYIRLKNFKSFGDVTFDLTDKTGNAKKLILIYGENGIGKSNLISAFYMLLETLKTMDVRDLFEGILENSPEKMTNEGFLTFLKSRFRDIEALIKDNKMVGSKDNLYMEFGFELNGKRGKYIIETDDNQIVYERLDYLLLKNRGIIFEMSKSKKFINKKVFFDELMIEDLKNLINKFWGKHSFLAIINHDIGDKAQDYYKNKISTNFIHVLHFLNRVSCDIKVGNKQERGMLGIPENYLEDYDKGTISVADEEKLNKTEKMLNSFFTTTYKDIESIYYNKDKVGDKIKYRLIIRKKIFGKVRDIDFELESTGTQSVIQLLPYMLISVEGSVAIIDEFDIGIHDILVKNLLASLYKSIEGQLIITTHNTFLMESNLPKESIYVINELEDSNKEIECILKYDNKIHPKTNIRNQYIHGKYKGIPEEIEIDFNKLVEMI